MRTEPIGEFAGHGEVEAQRGDHDDEQNKQFEANKQELSVAAKLNSMKSGEKSADQTGPSQSSWGPEVRRDPSRTSIGHRLSTDR